jgi:outer membrane lipoprotein-sorting protein
MASRVALPLFLSAALLAAVPGRAQLGPEIARAHAARAGERLAALRALRTEGKTFIGAEVVPFTTLAERPNRLRVESFTPQRRVVQACDGEHPPWIAHSEVQGGVPQPMPAGDAKDFLANADFDGPLVDYAAKGYSVDYAGEDTVDGRRAFKLLLMNRHDDIFFLWVDAGNHEVVKRVVYRVSGERRVTIETLFRDFRPVGGVLQPHRIETSADGRLLYVMVIDRMEANPPVPDGAFTRP